MRAQKRKGEETMEVLEVSSLLADTGPTFNKSEPIALLTPKARVAESLPLYASRAKRIKALLAALVACIVLSLVLLLHGSSAGLHASPPFITVNGTRFMAGCRPFYITGFNVDSIIEAAIGEVSRRSNPGHPSGRQMVDDLMAEAAASGLNVIRLWAHTTDPAHPLQVRPGVYDENVFQALDYVIAAARKAGLRVILSLVDTWRYRGGVGEMVDWSESAPKRDAAHPPVIVQGDVTPDLLTPEREAYESRRKALFFTDPGTKSIYKHHMKAILSRKNTFTGQMYKEDPTIMSFNLVNEPRCATAQTATCLADVQQWISEMAAYFKSIDRNHLLTVGEEGFWGPTEVNVGHNPGAVDGSTWAAETGQSFVSNHDLKDIDYAALHAWPDNFNVRDPEFYRLWLVKHAEDAAVLLGKPLLLEEAGKKLEGAAVSPEGILAQRDPVYEQIHSVVEESVAQGGALAGSMFWEMEFRIYGELSPPSPYAIKKTDSTFEIITQHAQRMSSLASSSKFVEHLGGSKQQHRC